MSSTDGWFAVRTVGAPPVLSNRAQGYLAKVPEAGTVAARLATAGRLALEASLTQTAKRTAALDLLTADSLLTLALLAQAEESPSGLAPFAEALVNAASA